MKHILIADSIERVHLLDVDLERKMLPDGFELSFHRVCSHEDKEALPLESVDVLIAWYPLDVDKPCLERLDRCISIVRPAVGFDGVDLKIAGEFGIPVINVPDYCTEEVADHAVALILTLIRRITTAASSTQSGLWDWKIVVPIRRLSSLNLGIIGLGRIGTAVARRMLGFGLKIGFFDPYLPSGIEKALGLKRFERLEELIEFCDILSLHTPLTKETFHLIGKRELALMRPDSILINTARGAIIDQNALLSCLHGHRLAGVGLDVLETEPQISVALRESGVVLLTPHCAFYSEQSLIELRTKALIAAQKALSGAPSRDIVNALFLSKARYSKRFNLQFTSSNQMEVTL